MDTHWCFILKYMFVLYVLRICNLWEFRFNLKYKQKNCSEQAHIVHSHMMVSSEMTARRRWPSVSISHTHTHSQWGSEADMSDRLSSQTLRERERNIAGMRDWKREEWSKRWLRTCEMWGECAIINFHIQPCQPALAIVTYRVLQTSRTNFLTCTYILSDGCMSTKTPIYCHTHSQKQFQITVLNNKFSHSFLYIYKKKVWYSDGNK